MPPQTLANLYCTMQDVFNLTGIDPAQLREDDRNLASGQVMQAASTAAAGATSIALAAALQYPMMAGTNLVFDGGGLPVAIEVTLSGVANAGAATLAVNPLVSQVTAGAQATDNGVTVWTASLMNVACVRATATVQRYCLGRYDDSQLVLDNSVNDWATTIAARWLAIRLYRAAPDHLEKMYDAAIEELKAVKSSELNLNIAPRTSEWPFLSNVTVDLGYTIRKIRVETAISEPTPTQYSQAIDWSSYFLLEW